MRVAIIIERANIILGGAERSVFELAGALASLRIQVHIIAAKGRTTAKNVRVLCGDVPGKRVSFETFVAAVATHVAQIDYDIVHSTLPVDFADIYQPRGGTYAETVLRNAASYPNPVLRAFKRTAAFSNRRRAMLLRAERELCRKPDGPRVLALSQYVAEQFTRHYALGSERIQVIANGVRIGGSVRQAAADRLRAQVLAQLGLKEADEPALFLFVANNFRLKGLGPLITALGAALDRSDLERPPYLIVVGRDSAHKYLRLARRLGIGRRILFLGPVRRIRDVLSITDVAVLPTYYDPASRFILEALARAKPVITTAFNGATDLFVDRKHGRIVDSPDNTDALAEAIAHFTQTAHISAASEAIVQDDLREQVSIMRVAKQLVPLYESIADAKGR